MRKSLTDKERLKKTEIKRIFREAATAKCFGFKVLYCRNNTGINRMAVTTPRNYGNAVERNRTKRIVKEVYRNIKERIIFDGYDFLFIVYKKNLEYKDTFLELITICRQAGIMNDSE